MALYKLAMGALLMLLCLVPRSYGSDLMEALHGSPDYASQLKDLAQIICGKAIFAPTLKTWPYVRIPNCENIMAKIQVANAKAFGPQAEFLDANVAALKIVINGCESIINNETARSNCFRVGDYWLSSSRSPSTNASCEKQADDAKRSDCYMNAFHSDLVKAQAPVPVAEQRILEYAKHLCKVVHDIYRDRQHAPSKYWDNALAQARYAAEDKTNKGGLAGISFPDSCERINFNFVKTDFGQYPEAAKDVSYMLALASELTANTCYVILYPDVGRDPQWYGPLAVGCFKKGMDVIGPISTEKVEHCPSGRAPTALCYYTAFDNRWLRAKLDSVGRGR